MPVGPRSGRTLRVLRVIIPFLRLPRRVRVEEAGLVFLGAPFDGATTYRPGARFGPRAARLASDQAHGFHAELGIDPFKVLQAVDAGDVNMPPHDIVAAMAALEQEAKAHFVENRSVFTVGGDHEHLACPCLEQPVRCTVLWPLLRGCPRYRHTAWGNDLHHGTPFRHAVREGLIEPSETLQLGLRGQFSGAEDLTFRRGKME